MLNGIVDIKLFPIKFKYTTYILKEAGVLCRFSFCSAGFGACVMNVALPFPLTRPILAVFVDWSVPFSAVLLTSAILSGVSDLGSPQQCF